MAQLWAYFIQGLENVVKGLEFETFLPDQPLRVCFRPDLHSKIVLIKVEDKKPICIEYNEFVFVMIEEARKFFEKLNSLSSYPYNSELKEIDSIEKLYNKKRYEKR